MTQDEADALLAMEKHRLDDQNWDYPGAGSKVSVPLRSKDGRNEFSLDVGRYGIRVNVVKGTYQHRHQTVVLARIDFGGSPHRNPDDEEVPCPHLHVYREGYDDKWAIPIPTDRFPQIEDPWISLDHFMDYCNIVSKPIFNRGLFP